MNLIEKNCGGNSMGFIERLEKNIAKLEKRIEKEQMNITDLQEKCDAKKITKAEFNIKKKQHETKIRAIGSRMRVLQGGLTKEKKHIEEREKEKEEKKKEKEEKKNKKRKKKE